MDAVNAQGVAVALFHDRDGVADVYRSTGGGWTRLDASALGSNATWACRTPPPTPRPT